MQKKINDITSIVKTLSLMLVGIILSKYITLNDPTAMRNSVTYYKIIIFFIPVMLLISIYFFWAFNYKPKSVGAKNFLNLIEICIFIIIYTAIIIITGGYNSDYKYIYLFIIITTTIQFDISKGLFVSFMCSIVTLGIDLFHGTTTGINSYFENDLILCGIFVLTGWTLGFYVKMANELINRLIEETNIDSLTKLFNHKCFHEKLHDYINSAFKNNQKVSMLFMDIDDFKFYNDTNGHKAGDFLLKELASVIKNKIGEKGVVCRYGGEEFAVILPNTNEEVAKKIAEETRREIASTNFPNGQTQPEGKLTVSTGISVYPDKANSAVELIKSADDALYRAKFFNKNRVEVYTSVLDEIKNHIDEDDIELVTSFKTLISVINAKDKYTYGHIERVVAYARLMADKLKLNEKDKRALIYGAYMHDIGKINISEGILSKKMKLTNEEWDELKRHPENGVEIISKVQSLKDVIPIVMHHHEKFNGKGYPARLKGYEIPYLARVLTVIDSYDAMTSNRPYNIRKSIAEATEELIKCKETHFDPDIVDLFIDLIKENPLA